MAVSPGADVARPVLRMDRVESPLGTILVIADDEALSDVKEKLMEDKTLGDSQRRRLG